MEGKEFSHQIQGKEDSLGVVHLPFGLQLKIHTN